jgi:hypothetical protein
LIGKFRAGTAALFAALLTSPTATQVPEIRARFMQSTGMLKIAPAS